jgi:uncharacterized membrane protein
MTLGAVLKTIVRLALGSFMVFAGVGHFRSTDSFLAQVPPFFPVREFIVQASGVVEICFGLSLLLINRYKAQIGLALAVFFVLVFPGNISQFLTHTSAFGLNTDTSRTIRLLFQPVLVVASLWCTGPIRGRLRIRKSSKE